MIESYPRPQNFEVAPAGPSERGVAASSEAYSGPLDLRALATHFPGYEIVEPVTVALRPVTIATPPARNGGRRV